MKEKIYEALGKYKADRVVMYKYEKGKPTDHIDFMEHEDVIVLFRPDGGINVCDGQKMISYPGDRLYEIVTSGEAMEYALKQSLVVVREQEKQLAQMEKFFEPKQ